MLLCSVFGPYAQDDEFGSRVINPMELYHNQVTRLQGPFSLRMFHRSWGLMFIQANLEAPCTSLDFPTLDRFVEELRSVEYDVVGIGSITINVSKVARCASWCGNTSPGRRSWSAATWRTFPAWIADRCRLYHPRRGGEVVPRVPRRRPRSSLASSADPYPRRCPRLGEPIPDSPRDVTATLIPSVGCPLGCNFCATSWMFGGKGKFFSFFPDAAELFDIMRQFEKSMGASRSLLWTRISCSTAPGPCGSWN